MVYRYGHRRKRHLSRVLVEVLVVSGVVAASGTALAYNDKLPIISSLTSEEEKEKQESNVEAGMGRNAKVISSKNKDANKKVEGAGTAKDLRIVGCGPLPASHANLSKAGNGLLRKLAEYEQVCSGAAVSRVMFFVPTPKDTAEAQSHANWVGDVLKEFSANGIAPLVVMEPTSGNGNLNFKDYRAGAYDAALDAYFGALKAKGLTDAEMGMWVPFPESNLPVWGSVDPSDFAANVTKTVQFQKKHFPGSKASILLESKSYPNGNSWEGGEYVSLAPYVKDIPKGLIDSFGLQGFTWPPTSEGDTPILEPKSFLRIDFAADAARTLGAEEIWFNTGTFDTSYVMGRNKPFTLTPAQRQAAMDGVVAQAKSLKNQGFAVAVHVFAKDKSATGEGINWSYWKSGQLDGPSTGVFRTLVHDLKASGIDLWLFDTTDE